jgi:hypothetical protein
LFSKRLTKETIMERQLWPKLYQLLRTAGKHHDRRGKQFSDSWIAVVYMWSVLHDRPISWACDPDNWRGESLAPLNLPSPSTMSRRLNGTQSLGVRQLLEQAQQITTGWFARGFCYWIDSKPLTVSGVSKDRQTRFGRAAGCKAKGYRMHVLCNAGGAVIAWLLAPMSYGDAPAAEALLNNLTLKQRCGQVPPLHGYSVGDNLYDATTLYEKFKTAGLQHVARPRKTAKALGHRRQSPHRLHGLELVKGAFGKKLLQARGGMERFFANATSFACGLNQLPAWVRTPQRVSAWVGFKLLIDAVRRARRSRLTA